MSAAPATTPPPDSAPASAPTEGMPTEGMPAGWMPAEWMEALVRRHQAGVWRYLRLVGCPPDRADDLVQETFLSVLRRPFVDTHPRATARYLRETARRVYLHEVRGDRRRQLRERTARADAADCVWERDCRDDSEEYLRALRVCIDKLTDRSRRAVELVYHDGLGRAATARELGLKENGVKTLLQRVRKTLRTCVEWRMRS